MARYNDEQYTLIQDCREKKSIAASAHKQRTHCGKSGGVKFPSDYMSKKELNSMNGECISYRMNEPITWDTFKTWPEEHQKSYIINLRNRFKIPNTSLATAWGVDVHTIGQYIRCFGLNQGREVSGTGRLWHDSVDAERFWAWWKGKEIPETVETPDLKEPMTWSVFKSLSSENQYSYIEWIRYIFDAPDKYIAENLFRVSPITLRKCLTDLNLNSGRECSGRGMKKWNKDSFLAWCDKNKKISGESESKTFEPMTEDDLDIIFSRHIETLEAEEKKFNQDISEEPETPVVCETTKIHDAGPIAFAGNSIPVIPKGGSMSFENNKVDDILATLRTILGGVRVNLTVQWECLIPEEDCICER